MKKIKSAIAAVSEQGRRLRDMLKEHFPKAYSYCTDFCKARPGVSISVAAVLVLLLIVGTCTRDKNESGVGSEGLLYAVTRGPLTISVVASGNIENTEKVIIRNKVEGAKATILSIVEEGQRVKKGDLLIELDSGDFEDQELDAQIVVDNGNSDVVRATETLAITKNQAQADIEKSELTLRFAKLALQKYAEGDYPQALQVAKTDITIAKEELRRSEERLEWSSKLSKEEFITRSEYQADELALRKRQIGLASAENSLVLLEKYTNLVNNEKLKSDVKQAELAMDRVQRKARADILKAEVDLSTKQVKHGRQIDQLEKIKERILYCRIIAPVDGLVVYATSVGRRHWGRRAEPLAEGQEIKGNRELIYLPTAGAMTVHFDVQEGSLTKITKDTPAVVTVDALPGRKFHGSVTKISVLPDTGQSWLNPDLKVYNCEVEIESHTEGMRPGMSCTVEVLHQQLDDVLFVPIQSVVQVDDEPTVFVKGFGSVAARQVETGLDNNRMIHIIKGVKEGEAVLLSPPLSEAKKKTERVEKAPSGHPSPGPTMTRSKKPAAAKPDRGADTGAHKPSETSKKPGNMHK
jgi:HlyD family secretion protein